MSNEKKEPVAEVEKEEVDLASSAVEAEAAEQAAQAEDDVGVYVHKFKTGFPCAGHIYEELTFRWDDLTAEDHIDIENEMLAHGKTLVTPEFSGEYLLGMAVRACTERDEKGRRVLNAQDVRAMPLADFTRIYKKARTFLLRAGQQ